MQLGKATEQWGMVVIVEMQYFFFFFLLKWDFIPSTL